MTVIFGVVASVLVLLLGAFGGAVADAVAASARAQAAADAVALAAVAESGPYGASKPHDTALRFADLNGATLVECACVPGASAVQVTVSVEGVEAAARAVFDARALRPAVAAFKGGGLHPTLAAAVETLESASRGAVFLVSGYRTRAQQASLWTDALRRYGTPERADDWVAPPGHSMHERGLAVDLGGDLTLALRLIGEFELPLYRPLANEPWHFELLGSRT